MTTLNDLVVAVVVVARIGLSSRWRTQKTRTMNILAVDNDVDVDVDNDYYKNNKS